MHDIEVDQQSNRSSAELEIRDDLRLMNRRNSLRRLDLHNDQILNQQIHAIPKIQPCTPVNHRKPHLSLGPDTRLLKFVMQASLVSAFQQSRTQLRMNFHCSSDDRAAHFLRAPSANSKRSHGAPRTRASRPKSPVFGSEICRDKRQESPNREPQRTRSHTKEFFFWGRSLRVP
jgi:hypothetical protein